MANSEEYKKGIERSGKIVLSFGREMSDAQLLKKLRSFNVILDKQIFSKLCKRFLSAEQMSEWLIRKQNLESKGMDIDWMWICLTVLWERWFPERPRLEMINEKMQEGYQKLSGHDCQGACEIWLEVWTAILNIMNSKRMKYLDEFDEIFRGTQSIFNWVQDLEMELGNAGRDEKKFLQNRIFFCEEFINRFPREDSLVIENMKRAIAESYFEIGEPEKTDSLYKKWLKEDPKWGWGWIGWSDCYWFYKKGNKDYEKAEKILKEGIAAVGVRDKREILDRLESLYSETGRKKEAEVSRQKIDILDKMEGTVEISKKGNILRLKKTLDFGEEGIPLDELDRPKIDIHKDWHLQGGERIKVGRNDPCPCGSGKKFKRCCGR